MLSGLIYWLDMAGVIVFALSGVILACRSRMDPFGMLVLGAVTGIGGGTLRDLVLGVRPVFWVTDPTYLWVILATVGLSIIGFHYIHRLSRVFLPVAEDRKSTRLNSSHVRISYAVFCLKKKKHNK